MSEFGKTKLLTAQQLSALGFNAVIYPVTTLRLAMKTVEHGLQVLKDQGTQAPLLDEMQTRAELYELIQYAQYAQFDKDVYNFRV